MAEGKQDTPLYVGDNLPVAPLNAPDDSWSTWGSALWDAVTLQPVYQTAGRTYDMLMAGTDGGRFNPYEGDYLKGYEAYTDEFIHTYHRAEADAMKARIDKNKQRRANVEANLGFGGLMLSELLNPVNVIPLPGVMGAGFAKGVLKGGAGFGATLTAEELLRQQVDPTATAEESWNNVLYGTLFGGVLSGAVGAYGRANARDLGERFAAELKVMERGPLGQTASDAEPIIQSGTGFVARPSGDAAVGVAPAYGLENQTKITLWGRLKNLGVRAVEDFADAVAGDYGTLSARNRQQLPTEMSAYLASQLWRGQAADFSTKLNRIYSRYLTGGDGGMEVMGLNLATAPQKIVEFFGKGSRADGKLTYEEFKDAIFRAHKSDRIEADNPFVKEGADLVRGFFDEAMEKGVASGAIRSAEGFKKLLSRRAERGRQMIARFEELSAKGQTVKAERRATRRAELTASVAGTRVVGPDDKPLVVFHGTSENFDKFKGRGRKETPLSKAVRQLMLTFDWGDTALKQKASERGAVWFTANSELADDYAKAGGGDGVVREAHLNLQRPLEYDNATKTVTLPNGQQLDFAEVFGTFNNWSIINPQLIPLARQHGADGLILRSISDPATKNMIGAASDVFIVFNPDKQIVLLDNLLPDEAGLSVNEIAELAELTRQQQRLLDWMDKRLDDELPADEGLKAVLDEIEKNAADRRAQMEATRNDLLAKGEKRREDTEQLLADVQATIAARIDKDEKLLAYFNQKEEQIGLTDAERVYRDAIAERQWANDFDGSPAQQMLRQRLQQALAGVDARAQEAMAQLDGFDFSYNPDAKIGATVYHGTREDLTTFVDADGNLVLRPSENFGGKQQGVSFAAERNLAADYATRAGERRDVRGAVVFEIDTAALPKLDPETMGEAFAKTDGDVVIPAGRWKATDAITGKAIDLDAKADGTSFLTGKQRDYLDRLEQRLAGAIDRYEGPKNEANYISRVWDIDQVRQDPQRLTQILFDWFKKNPLPGASMNDGAIMRRAEEAVSQIMRESELGEMQIMKGGGASFLSSRKIDIPNELVADFLVTDVEHIVRNYAHRFGLVQEFSRKFGTFDAEDAIDDVILQSARELQFADLANAEAQLGRLRQDMGELRDTVTGAIYSTDPAMMNKRRIAAGLRAYGTVTSLGRAALSSVPELGRGIMVNGFMRTFGFALDILGNREAWGKISGELARLTGEGCDMVLSSVIERFQEQGGPLGAATGKVGRAVQKGINFTNGPYFLTQGLAAITDITKRLNLTFINQFMIEDMAKLVQTGDAKLAERLASYGLSADDARRIVQEMPVERQGQMYLPNVGEWSDGDLATRYLTAVTGMSRRIVPTAGPADVPMIAKGFIAGREFPLLTMPFQFMQYGFAAINKVTLSALQGRDQSPVAGLAIIMGLAWVAQNLKTDDQQWHRMPVEEKLLRVADASGVLGLYQDIPNKLEILSGGRVGVRPMLGMEPFNKGENYADYADIGGPAVGKIADLTRVMSGDDMTDREMAGIIRRSIPLNDVLWWRDSFIEAERYAFEAVED